MWHQTSKNNTSWRVAAPSAQFSERWKPGKRCGRSNLFIECGHLLMLLMQGSQDSQSADVNEGNDHGWMKDGAQAVARMCGKNWGTRSQWCSVPRTRPQDGDAEMKYPSIYQWISLCTKRSMLGDRQTWTFLTFLQVLQCCWTPPWAISWTSTDTAGHLT